MSKSDRIDLGFGLRQAEALGDPGEHLEAVGAVCARSRNGQREIHVGWTECAYCVRGDTDDRIRPVSNPQALANHREVIGEAAAPEALAQNDLALPSRFVIAIDEQTSGDRRCSKNGKELRA